MESQIRTFPVSKMSFLTQETLCIGKECGESVKNILSEFIRPNLLAFDVSNLLKEIFDKKETLI